MNFGREDGQGNSGSDVGPLNISDEEQDNSLQVQNAPSKDNKIYIDVSSVFKNTSPFVVTFPKLSNLKGTVVFDRNAKRQLLVPIMCQSEQLATF